MIGAFCIGDGQCKIAHTRKSTDHVSFLFSKCLQYLSSVSATDWAPISQCGLNEWIESVHLSFPVPGSIA